MDIEYGINTFVAVPGTETVEIETFKQLYLNTEINYDELPPDIKSKIQETSNLPITWITESTEPNAITILKGSISITANEEDLPAISLPLVIAKYQEEVIPFYPPFETINILTQDIIYTPSRIEISINRPNICPYCFSEEGTWTSDAIRTKNGIVGQELAYRILDIFEDNLDENTITILGKTKSLITVATALGLNFSNKEIINNYINNATIITASLQTNLLNACKGAYYGFISIYPTHILELQSRLNDKELELNLSQTSFTPVSNVQESWFNMLRIHIVELRTSIITILEHLGETLTKYLNCDENYEQVYNSDDTNYKSNWTDSNLTNFKGHIKAQHIEELRKPIPLPNLYARINVSTSEYKNWWPESDGLLGETEINDYRMAVLSRKTNLENTVLKYANSSLTGYRMFCADNKYIYGISLEGGPGSLGIPYTLYKISQEDFSAINNVQIQYQFNKTPALGNRVCKEIYDIDCDDTYVYLYVQSSTTTNTDIKHTLARFAKEGGYIGEEVYGALSFVDEIVINDTDATLWTPSAMKVGENYIYFITYKSSDISYGWYYYLWQYWFDQPISDNGGYLRIGCVATSDFSITNYDWNILTTIATSQTTPGSVSWSTTNHFGLTVKYENSRAGWRHNTKTFRQSWDSFISTEITTNHLSLRKPTESHNGSLYFHLRLDLEEWIFNIIDTNQNPYLYDWIVTNYYKTGFLKVNLDEDGKINGSPTVVVDKLQKAPITILDDDNLLIYGNIDPDAEGGWPEPYFYDGPYQYRIYTVDGSLLKTYTNLNIGETNYDVPFGPICSKYEYCP